MKLLFDENLSRLLVPRLTDLFPGSDHIVLLGLETASDAEILRYAHEENFVLVSKDSDFTGLLAAFAESPGVVWIRTGNCDTEKVENLIRANAEQIEAIGASTTVRLLMLY